MNQIDGDNQVQSVADGGQPCTRSELVIVLALVLTGFVLRAWRPGRMSVEHFDEGVYASNIFCGPVTNPESPYSYPDRQLYAPPLYPALLECVMLATHGSPGSVMWVNVLVGTLTVLAVWWVARDWFGPVAGVIAALLAATSDYHIAFSRTALTDPLLCLFLLLAVYAGWKAVLTRGPLWMAIAGGCAGLAWCTKYNGWLALAITGSGSVAWIVFFRPSGRGRSGLAPVWEQTGPRGALKTVVSVLLVWVATALIAGASFWFFVVRDLADKGGYAGVAANHAHYFVGVTGWWESLCHQFTAHRQLDGWISLTGLASACLLGSLLHVRCFTWNGYWKSAGRLGSAVLVSLPLILALAILVIGFSPLVALVGLFGLKLTVRARSRVSTEDRSDVEGDQSAAVSLAGWMTAAWFFGLLVAVPLYRAYPRLSLPWLIPCWLAAAVAFSSLIRSPFFGRRWDAGTAGFRVSLVAALVVLAGAAAAAARWRGSPFVPARFIAWQDRTELARIARKILTDAERAVAEMPQSQAPNVDAVFYVYGEPAIFFHLETLADTPTFRFISQPAGNLSLTQPGATDPRVATFLITGMHADAHPEQLRQATAGLPEIATYPYTPSTLVRLDDTRSDGDRDEPAEVHLFLLHRPLEN